MASDAFDPVNRELCPDEMCVGLIGDDGRCKECGKLAPGSSYRGRVVDVARDEGEDEHEHEHEHEHVHVHEDGDDEDQDPDIASRELCPDDLCVGVIGPGGRCKVCGKTGSSVHS
jgi:hypothetical protein